ncbi:hypothetical protein JAAARDRAFT_37771 [Jaapia argillacea MUCL 33604]|uniref:Uncharacterized protein n=1 Tax=Jaapia argillacea MUCL 33604 TaxID=933084 RepID=A0A067PY15_9AGAM|nr:hypothetical protein JAAARDRAFT_37771 [Jaapia argillacea MUCL 33604]
MAFRTNTRPISESYLLLVANSRNLGCIFVDDDSVPSMLRSSPCIGSPHGNPIRKRWGERFP